MASKPGQLLNRLHQPPPDTNPETTYPVPLIAQPLKVLLDKVALGGNSGVVELRLTGNDQAAATDKLEVGSSPASVNLANQLARRVPDVDTITNTGVDVALAIGVDT